jgi:hypothetical protein
MIILIEDSNKKPLGAAKDIKWSVDKEDNYIVGFCSLVRLTKNGINHIFMNDFISINSQGKPFNFFIVENNEDVENSKHITIINSWIESFNYSFRDQESDFVIVTNLKFKAEKLGE